MYYLIIQGDPQATHEIKQSISVEHYEVNNTITYPKVNGEYDQTLYILRLISFPASVINNINFNLYRINQKIVRVGDWLYSYTGLECSVIVSDGDRINPEELESALIKIKNKINQK